MEKNMESKMFSLTERQKSVYTKQNAPYRSSKVTSWMPKDPRVIKEWLLKLKKEIFLANSIGLDRIAFQSIGIGRGEVEIKLEPLDDLLVEFKQMIETDATLHMQYTQMFTEALPPGSKLSLEDKVIKNYDEMFVYVNYVMKHYTPTFSDSGLVGFPINAILNWPMGTTNGYAAFLNEKANGYWRRVINKWQDDVLATGRSLHVLTNVDEKSWFSKPALCKMTGQDPDNTTQEQALDEFKRLYKCKDPDPSPGKHLGFKSWDEFFVREFNPGVRPVEQPGDQCVINNACESYPYSLRNNVQLVDEFWVKEHKYSLKHLFGEDPDVAHYAQSFVDGTVYQAFLSATSYHRWHSPVTGEIKAVKNIPGSYYSSSLCVGPDPEAPNLSQGYICQVAARAIIVIEAANPAIGTMCVVEVGMAEVSTCEVTVQVGDRVRKGDEIGMFHFGGSTHCLIFGPQVVLKFIDRVYTDLDDNPDNNADGNIPLNAKLAVCMKCGLENK